ncbi:MAG: hypothetical protein EAY76_00735 [Alphaproteobacteria bacterium]|nr:MAG: hypothetical protein EAY76_00735 [Alphaproteobacteria bacterium]
MSNKSKLLNDIENKFIENYLEHKHCKYFAIMASFIVGVVSGILVYHLLEMVVEPFEFILKINEFATLFRRENTAYGRCIFSVISILICLSLGLCTYYIFYKNKIFDSWERIQKLKNKQIVYKNIVDKNITEDQPFIAIFLWGHTIFFLIAGFREYEWTFNYRMGDYRIFCFLLYNIILMLITYFFYKILKKIEVKINKYDIKTNKYNLY